ncbi:MAG: deoxyuridine 5'-triphosphate nucleotidohydrolase [Clostridia bacterium]|nr:deoxyuridine 5'-triphosphate nucleotidohydrolase [Clostridia bacterium]
MRIARFLHVSEAQYIRDMGTRQDVLPVEEIPLPKRSTRGSAGYDFVSPVKTVIPAGGQAVIPTGIRCEMEEGWVLMLFPRSGLGFRYQTRLSNTVGIIDSDYALADNEGHIQVSLRNPLDRELEIGKGERFCQGIFLPYGLAEEEADFAQRKGGMGSTGK